MLPKLVILYPSQASASPKKVPFGVTTRVQLKALLLSRQLITSTAISVCNRGRIICRHRLEFRSPITTLHSKLVLGRERLNTLITKTFLRFY